MKTTSQSVETLLGNPSRRVEEGYRHTVSLPTAQLRNTEELVNLWLIKVIFWLFQHLNSEAFASDNIEAKPGVWEVD